VLPPSFELPQPANVAAIANARTDEIIFFVFIVVIPPKNIA
jgi:hypothetical protein